MSCTFTAVPIILGHFFGILQNVFRIMNTLPYFRNNRTTFHLLSDLILNDASSHNKYFCSTRLLSPETPSLRLTRFVSHTFIPACLTILYFSALLSFLFFLNMLFVQSETLLPLAAPCSHIKQRHGGVEGVSTQSKWLSGKPHNFTETTIEIADNDTNNNGRTREKL